MFFRKHAFIALLFSALLLNGCSASDYGRVMTKGDGTHEILAEGDSQAHADKNALTAAELICKESGRSGHFVTIHREGAYQGAMADAQQHRTVTDLLNVAGAILGGPISSERSHSSRATYSSDGTRATTRTSGSSYSVYADPACASAALQTNAYATRLIIRCQ